MMVKGTDEARPRRNDPDAPLCHGVLHTAAAPDKPGSRRRFLSKAPITRLNAPSSFVFIMRAMRRSFAIATRRAARYASLLRPKNGQNLRQY